jgi:cytochrome c556
MQKRAALLILLGLAIGILGTVFTLRALRQRDPFPTAVMSVMAHHMGALGHAVKTQRCDATRSREHLLRLQSTASDIPAAFAGAEQPFMDAAGKLRNALQDANANTASLGDCAALAAAIKPVGDACESCHQQFR